MSNIKTSVRVYGQVFGLTYEGYEGTYVIKEFDANSVEEAKNEIDVKYSHKDLDGFGFSKYLAGMFTLEIEREKEIDGEIWKNLKYDVYQIGSEMRLKDMRTLLKKQWRVK